MKITGAKTRALSAPEENPLIVGKDPGGIREYVSLELSTDEGIKGLGISFFGWKLTPALKTAVDIMADLVIGDDPMQPEAVTGKIRESGSGSGPGGIFTLALSAIDIALWDIKGKALNQPVYKLLGGYRDRAPTYASGALGRPFNVEYLAEAGPRLVSMGFKQMKTQLGAEPTVGREIQRIRVLRDAIGDDIDLMCDVNQLWSVNQAIGIGRQLEEYHLFWLEDVVAHDDYQGFARVADALTTPIAAGEYVYGIRPFRHMLEQRSIDIVMVDMVRAGGVTQFMKIAGMAEAFNLPVVSHLIPEYQVHTICAIPNGLTVEYMPWTLGFYEETPQIIDGKLVAPDKPGFGLELSEKALATLVIE